MTIDVIVGDQVDLEVPGCELRREAPPSPGDFIQTQFKAPCQVVMRKVKMVRPGQDGPGLLFGVDGSA
ncbi:hypothetical protein X566_03080 [Afipia sp. P52-10]|nr:hypothetical protein X566_03080 [Afipia sp. P52-10]